MVQVWEWKEGGLSIGDSLFALVTPTEAEVRSMAVDVQRAFRVHEILSEAEIAFKVGRADYGDCHGNLGGLVTGLQAAEMDKLSQFRRVQGAFKPEIPAGAVPEGQVRAFALQTLSRMIDALKATKKES